MRGLDHSFNYEQYVQLNRNIQTSMRDGKAVGIDLISAEVLKALDERGIKIMHFLCQKI